MKNCLQQKKLMADCCFAPVSYSKVFCCFYFYPMFLFRIHSWMISFSALNSLMISFCDPRTFLDSGISDGFIDADVLCPS